ncbi:MAG: ABC transporter permease [Opitutales bacterium]|nr:ABC transporter permease [Opitutales bacterium]NRA27051.1 ABC transporter permease [Opitutales bacterium]
MSSFIFSRILQAIPVVLIIITLTFFMVRLAPGGPFDQERAISESAKEAINKQYGLDKPLIIQFGNYLKGVFQGDLGPSLSSPGRKVQDIIADKFPNSLQLGLYSLLFAICVGVPAGLIASLKQNSWLDYIPMTSAMIGICLPTFVIGPVLSLIFGVWLGWLPVLGWSGGAEYKVLPTVTLGLAYAAYIARLTRGGMLEILGQDYIRTAWAKGASTFSVVFKHAFRGGIMPVVSFLGPALAGLISGSFVVETIFVIPGLGQEFVKSALNRDYFLVLGTVLFYQVLIISVNIAVDVAVVWLYPRAKFD